MKNLLFTFSALILMLLGACNNIDNALVEKIQASQNKIKDIKTEIDSGAQNVENLNEQLVKAPNGLKTSPDFGFPELFTMVNGFSTKYGTIQSSLEEMNTKLEGLLANYVDGKIKKKEVEQEYATTITDLSSFESANARLVPMFDEVSATYAKMMANWKALPEEEQATLNAQAESGTGAPGRSPGAGTTAIPGSTAIPGATGTDAAAGSLKAADKKNK